MSVSGKFGIDKNYHCRCLASLAVRISSGVVSVFKIPNSESETGVWAFLRNSSSSPLVMPIFPPVAFGRACAEAGNCTVTYALSAVTSLGISKSKCKRRLAGISIVCVMVMGQV